MDTGLNKPLPFKAEAMMARRANGMGFWPSQFINRRQGEGLVWSRGKTMKELRSFATIVDNRNWGPSLHALGRYCVR